MLLEVGGRDGTFRQVLGELGDDLGVVEETRGDNFVHIHHIAQRNRLLHRRATATSSS